MIDIQLSELDLSLEVADIGDLSVILDDHSTIGLQGPLVFGVDVEPTDFGYLDLDLIGFPYHGLSAYEVAVKNGFIGTEAEWLASLKGEPGDLSLEGRNGVILAQASASSAQGSANAAAGFRSQAFAYSNSAGIYAQASLESYTNAEAIKNETGEFAIAMTSIFQQSTAMIIGAEQLANATIQQRVLAETARSQAEAFRNQSATSRTNASESSASATDQATLAVNARNTANDRANAAILAESNASSYANDAQVEAQAANQSKIIATAARDEAQITAEGVIIDVARASAFADDAQAYSLVSRDERLSAEAAFNNATTASNQSNNYAQASLGHSQTAQGFANSAGSSSSAANQHRLDALAASNAADGQRAAAVIAKNEAVTAKQDAEGARATAIQQAGIAVSARNDAGVHASSAFQSRNEAAAYVDQAGSLYGAISSQYNAISSEITNARGTGSTLSAKFNSLIQAYTLLDQAQTSRTDNISAEITNARGGTSSISARFNSVIQAYTDLNSSVTGRTSSLEGRMGGAEGRLTTTENVALDALGKINITYGVSLNANGFITGYRASNNGTIGAFTIVGNEFRLVDPNGGQPFSPFTVIGNEATFNTNVRINGNLIVTGTISTPSLVNNIVTGVVIATNPNTVALNNNIPTRIHGQYINVEYATSPVDIIFNAWATFTHNAGGSFIAYVQLVRSRGDSGGDVLETVPIYGSGMANDTWQGPIPVMFVDRPNETGNWHYYVQIFTNVSNMSTQSVVARYCKLTELKNNPSASINSGTGSGAGTGSGVGTGGGGGEVDPGGGGGIGDPPSGGGGGFFDNG